MGCQQQYRPVVSAINPVGPAAQPQKYAIAISSPSPTAAGLITLVDFAGDTVVATQPIIANPSYLAYQVSTGQAIAINNQNLLTDVQNASSPTALVPNQIQQTTLPSDANAATVSSFTLGASARILLPEPGRSAIAVLSTAPPALQQEITVGVNPVYVVGNDTTPRAYAISNGNGSGIGQVAAIEGSSLSVSNTINVGTDPVYGVQTADLRRVFITNKGSGTVSVINVTNNALDVANPTIAVGPNPIWADLNTVNNELVVLNQGDGTHAGSLSVINIPLCNTAALPTNPSCDPTNPVDGVGFGTVVATVPVGVNPLMVSVLSDGTRAYVVNAGSAGTPGSVSVVNLSSNTVTATIPAAIATNPTQTAVCPDGTTATCIYGSPTTVTTSRGTPTGKVYVTAPNSNYLSVIETDTDTLDTHVALQGAGVRVLVSAP